MFSWRSRTPVAAVAAAATMFLGAATTEAIVTINPGTAVIDGFTSEWDLTISDTPGKPYDFVAPMWKAGNANHNNPEILANLFMKYAYDPQAETGYLFVLVMAADGRYLEMSGDDAFVKIDNWPGSGKLIGGSAGDPGIFEWVSPNTPSAGFSLGWEGAGLIAPGQYPINVHAMVYDDETAALDGRSLAVELIGFLEIDPVDPEPNNPAIPEPATAAMALLGGMACVTAAFRRRGRREA